MPNTTKQISCFAYLDYRNYLKDRLPVTGTTRGQRSKLAAALGLQTAFVSRVLHGEAEFSLEHAMTINRFLGHTEGESEFFVLLIQWGRAGTAELKAYWKRKLDAILEQRQIVAERIQIKETLNSEDQMTYYSAWYFSAVHIMLMVPRWQTASALAEYLQLPLAQVNRVLEFLVGVSLAKEEAGKFTIGKNRIHLGKNSPILPRHHSNWRMRGMQSMERFSGEDLFYSGPISLSEADAKKIREMLLSFLEQKEKLIEPSPEETVFCLGIDYFRL
ncbi:MAG: TIGR02147 family protein [Bacteriovoracia bacterium]